MFTGIIEAKGMVNFVENKNSSLNLRVEMNALKASIGDSICINGVCLTVEKIQSNTFSFSVSPETYNLSNIKFIKEGDEVNIETSLTINKLISGHIVQGHVDTTSKIIDLAQVENSWLVKFQIDSKYMKYIIQKGSIAIDGVSLTVNEVYSDAFSVMIIPHTWQNTIFKNYNIGNITNIEVDVLAKYVEKLGK